MTTFNDNTRLQVANENVNDFFEWLANTDFMALMTEEQTNDFHTTLTFEGLTADQEEELTDLHTAFTSH